MQFSFSRAEQNYKVLKDYFESVNIYSLLCLGGYTKCFLGYKVIQNVVLYLVQFNFFFFFQFNF